MMFAAMDITRISNVKTPFTLITVDISSFPEQVYELFTIGVRIINKDFKTLNSSLKFQ